MRVQVTAMPHVFGVYIAVDLVCSLYWGCNNCWVSGGLCWFTVVFLLQHCSTYMIHPFHSAGWNHHHATCVWHVYSCRPPYLECRESGGLGPRFSAATRSWSRAFFISRWFHRFSYSCFVVSTRQRPGSPSAGLLLPWQPQLCAARYVRIVLNYPPPINSLYSI